MNDIITDEHRLLARKFKRLNSLLKENEVLLRIGAYQRGTDRELDEAISKKDFMQNFVQQTPEESFEFEQVMGLLKMIGTDAGANQNANMAGNAMPNGTVGQNLNAPMQMNAFNSQMPSNPPTQQATLQIPPNLPKG